MELALLNGAICAVTILFHIKSAGSVSAWIKNPRYIAFILWAIISTVFMCLLSK